MNSYTPDCPPKGGTALKIWSSLSSAGIVVEELHYNPNCWGNARNDGWGTWACTTVQTAETWCGWSARHNCAYLQGMSAPYAAVLAARVLGREISG